MKVAPHLVIRRPHDDELEPVVREMRIELVRAGVRWAEFFRDPITQEIVAQGWPDRPEGAVETAHQENSGQ